MLGNQGSAQGQHAAYLLASVNRRQSQLPFHSMQNSSYAITLEPERARASENVDWVGLSLLCGLGPRPHRCGNVLLL